MTIWIEVGAGALCVTGLAVMLAALSRAHWVAGLQRTRLAAVLGAFRYQAARDLGLMLVFAGLFLGTRSTWQRVTSAALALVYAGLGCVEWRREGRDGERRPVTKRAASDGGVSAGWRANLSACVQRFDLWWAVAALPFLLFPGWYSRWVLVALAVPWILRQVSTGRPGIRTEVDLPILALLLWLPVSWSVSADTGTTGVALYRLLAGVVLFYAVVNWAGTARRLKMVAALLALGGAGMAVMAALSPVTASSWALPKVLDAVPAVGRLRALGTSVIGEDINANVLGGGLALILPVAMALVPLRSGARGRCAAIIRLCLTVVLAVMTVILVLTQSRGALLGLIVALALMAAVRWRSARILVALALATGALLLWRAGAGQLPRLADALFSTGTVTSLSGRGEIWSRALLMIRDFPYTGIGLGTFDRVQPLMYPLFTYAVEVHHAHNLFLQVALDLGLPGLIAYLGLMIGTILGTWKLWQRTRTRPETRSMSALALGLLGSQTVLVVHGMLDATAWANKLAFLPWLILGMAVAGERVVSEEARKGVCS